MPEGGAAAENMDTQNHLEAALFSIFLPTSIVCQGLVQTGLDLHPMSTSADGFLHLLLKYLRRRT